MKNLDQIVKELQAPFDYKDIYWRVGATSGKKGLAFAYLDARAVQDRFDKVCGPHWSVVYPWARDGKLCCRITVTGEDGFIERENGAGDTGVEAAKGAFSDAFKRAAVMFGVGRYLYDLPDVWVELDGRAIAQYELKSLKKMYDEWLVKIGGDNEQA